MKIIYIIALLCIFSCKDNSNTKNPSELNSLNNSNLERESTSDSLRSNKRLGSIPDIKQEYNYLKTKLENGDLDSVSFVYNCYNEKSGTVVFYLDKETLRMVKHSYNEHSHFSSVTKYFIKNNSPFFIFQKDLLWSFDGEIAGEPQPKDNITERRFYINNH